mmetsp:Transcript_20336/g.30959  ORF Transcript_20336/g.30959 Transcript_20336/m.30959 type:complete len:274 (+) Transcript_20336:245-1066(+)
MVQITRIDRQSNHCHCDQGECENLEPCHLFLYFIISCITRIDLSICVVSTKSDTFNKRTCKGFILALIKVAGIVIALCTRVENFVTHVPIGTIIWWIFIFRTWDAFAAVHRFENTILKTHAREFIDVDLAPSIERAIRVKKDTHRDCVCRRAATWAYPVKFVVALFFFTVHIIQVILVVQAVVIVVLVVVVPVPVSISSVSACIVVILAKLVAIIIRVVIICCSSLIRSAIVNIFIIFNVFVKIIIIVCPSVIHGIGLIQPPISSAASCTKIA